MFVLPKHVSDFESMDVKIVDPAVKERIRELLSQGWTYRRIQKELGVSSRQIAKVSKELKGVIQVEEIQALPEKEKQEIARLKAKKIKEQLKMEIEKIKAEAKGIILKEELLEQIFKILIHQATIIQLVIPYLVAQYPELEKQIEELAKNMWRQIFTLAKMDYKKNLIEIALTALTGSINVTKEEILRHQGWLEEYGITRKDIKRLV